MNMEIRVQDTTFSSNEDGTMTVSGYVNKTEQYSNVLGVTKKFIEKIARGAFSKALENANDVDFLAEHRDSLILASTANGSLKLTEDDQGLFMEATITPTSWGKDYYELIKSGIHRHMSFGFRTIKDSWRSLESGIYERTIEELELFEVSVVKTPAYSQSMIAARGINLIEDVEIPAELEEETRNMNEMKDLLEGLVQEVRNLTEQVKALSEKPEDLPEEKVEDEVAEPEKSEDEPTEPEATEEEPEKVDPEPEEEPEEKSEDKPEEEEETAPEETEEAERSMTEKPDFSEYRNRIKNLKQAGTNE